MARKRTSPVHKYFKFNISTGKSVCQIESCGHELAGEHAKNLERHIESLHYEIFEKNLSVKSREMEKKKKCNEQKTIKVCVIKILELLTKLYKVIHLHLIFLILSF